MSSANSADAVRSPTTKQLHVSNPCALVTIAFVLACAVYLSTLEAVRPGALATNHPTMADIDEARAATRTTETPASHTTAATSRAPASEGETHRLTPLPSEWGAGPLRCYASSITSFYDAQSGECRKLDFVNDSNAAVAANGAALLPTDPTLVPILDAYASSLSPTRSNPLSTAGSPFEAAPLIAERFAPSRHSRWLLGDWRLWEGELPCSNHEELRQLATPHAGIFARSAEGRTSDPLPADVDPRHAPFVTRGHHRDRLPSSLYELENACIDEESGRLYAFAGANAKGGGLADPVVKQHEGHSEYPLGFAYIGTDRLFSMRNRETVPIVRPRDPANSITASTTANASAWRRTITASLAAYLRPSAAAASVLFVEDTALMMPLSTTGSNNPGHMYQRIAVAASQARLLGARSIVYLADYVSLADSAASEYFSLYGLNEGLTATAAGLEALLPPYLNYTTGVSGAPKTVVRERPGPKRRRPQDVDRTPVQALAHVEVHVMAAALASGRLVPDVTPLTLAHPLHMSGERGCEAMRCAGAAGTVFPPSALADVGAALARGEAPSDRHCPVEEVADLRRCGRRHIAINVAPPIPYDGRYLDTEGHAPEVWNGAMKETMREGRRVRADLLAASTALLPTHAPPLPANASRAERYEWYQRLWRARLVSLITRRKHRGGNSSGYTNINVRIAKSIPDDKTVLKAYFADFMGAQLELRSLAAKEAVLRERSATSAGNAAHSRDRRRQLVCYRSVVISQNHRHGPGTSTERGTLSIANVPTCHDAEGLKNAYESTAARFATCPPAGAAPPSESEVGADGPAASASSHADFTQANNTNRDAHPLFTLPPAVQSELAASFTSSQAAVEAVLAEAAVLSSSAGREGASLAAALLSDTSTVDLRASVPAVAALLERVEAAQMRYDTVLMDYFKRSPIRAYGAVRLKKRAILHTRSIFAAMADGGGGNGGRMADYVTVEAQEGLQAEGRTPQSERAAQYRRALSADVLFGPHGADMHSTAYVKPSALVLEFGAEGVDNYPRGTYVFEYGYFSQLTFARSVGYLRINAHSEPGVGQRSAYLSLPEWRHAMANAVCSWLACNAVRLGDESRSQAANASAAAEADFSHFVPWWCRGGPIAVVEGLREALRRERPDAARSSRASPPLTAHAASMHSIVTFLRRRSARSVFGFSVPNCPPLAPSVSVSTRSVRLGSTSFGQAVLNRLQTECARPVTRAVHDAPERLLLRAIESLQSHVEIARLRVGGTEATALLSFLAVHGTGALLPAASLPKPFWRSRRGEVSVTLLGALLDGGAAPEVPAAFRAAVLAIQSGSWEGISDARNAVPYASPAPLAPNASAVDRQFVLDFIRNGVAATGTSVDPRAHRPPDISASFSYGMPLECPNALTPPYFKKPCYGNWPRAKLP